MAVERGGNGHRKEVSSESSRDILSSVDSAVAKGMMRAFVLRGPSEERIQIHLAVLLRDLPETKQIEYIILADEGNKCAENEVDSKIASLEIPSHLKNENGSLEDIVEFGRASAILVRENTPLVMLAWGESYQTEQEAIVLYVVKGITIETAIKTLLDVNQELKGSNQQN